LRHPVSVFHSLFALICLAFAGAAPGVAATASAEPAAGYGMPEYATLYLVRRGWHIDVGFEAADIEAPLGSVVTAFAGVQYLFFGFGDRRYLLSKHRQGPVLLEALWPGAGLILVTALKSAPDAAFGHAHVIALRVRREQLRGAQDLVRRSIDPPEGPFRPYAPGPYEGSAYYSARDRYSAAYTCNTWAAQVLTAGDLPVHSHGVVFAGQLWRQIRRLQSSVN